MAGHLISIDTSGTSAITAFRSCRKIVLQADGTSQAGDYSIQVPDQAADVMTKAMGAVTELTPEPGRDRFQPGDIVAYGKALAPATIIILTQEEYSW